MSSRELNYLDYDTFLNLLFGLVKEQLDLDPNDPLPDYRKEKSENLEKILEFVREDALYPTIVEKAAYLFVSIVEGHIYSNGNKRLGFVAMLYFLTINRHDILLRSGEGSKLALYVADKARNNDASFDELKLYVENFIRERMVMLTSE